MRIEHCQRNNGNLILTFSHENAAEDVYLEKFAEELEKKYGIRCAWNREDVGDYPSGFDIEVKSLD